MSHQDAELSDVFVVLEDEPGMTTKDAADKLAGMGLVVTEVHEADGFVGGTIESAKVGNLRKLPFVKAVRESFKYIADYPTGDPRDLDKEEDEGDLSSEADDAGA